MAGISFKTLNDYTVKSDYGIGELKLDGKGNLEKINHHASEHYAKLNKVTTNAEQNQQVRDAVYQCLEEKFRGTGIQKLDEALILAFSFLQEGGNRSEILSRDEAGYIISMLQKAKNDGEFDSKQCIKDINLIREIKKNGVTQANMEDAQRLIRGLQVSGRFKNSIAIRAVSENYSQIRQNDVNLGQNMNPFETSTPTPGGTPDASGTPSAGNRKTFELTKKNLSGVLQKCRDSIPNGGNYQKDTQGACRKSFTILLSAMFYKDGNFNELDVRGLPLSELEDKFNNYLSGLMTSTLTKNCLSGTTYGDLHKVVLERLSKLPPEDSIFTDYTSQKLKDLGDVKFLENFQNDLERIFPKKVEVQEVKPKLPDKKEVQPQGKAKSSDEDLKKEILQNETEKLNKQTASTPMNNNASKNTLKNLEIIDVSDDHLYFQDQTENVGKAEKNEQPKNVSGWNAVSGRQRTFFDGTLVGKIGEHESDWRNMPASLSKAGFKALVMCWLDKNPGRQTRIGTSFKADAFRKLAEAFENVCTNTDLEKISDKKIGNASSFSEFIFGQYDKLAKGNPVDASLQLLIGGGEVTSEKVENFKAALKTTLLAQPQG